MTAGGAFVALDDAGADRVRLFRDPERIIRADTPDAVPDALAAADAALLSGRHLAGYASYELGTALEPRLRRLAPAAPAVPFLWFGVFDRPPVLLEGPALEQFWGEERAWFGRPEPDWAEAEYAERFRAVVALIASGDIFQANLTFRARFPVLGAARTLYRSLRPHGAARHGALVHDGERDILSLSPELFVAVTADGRIRAAPMKGTAPRGADEATDAANRDGLAVSAKDRAENLMIVDLMRNDLGRLAAIGSVDVDRLFAVETYPTLHTMVSHVTARLAEPCSPGRLLRAIFPCGSITGAPKIRAIEILHALEAGPRGVYCGAIGQFAPDGSADLNVAIRTITVADNRATIGIGGAVTSDSDAAAEWSEALLKARFLDRARRPVALIETLRHEDGAFVRRDRHLARLAASAAAFAIAFDPARAFGALADAVAGRAGPLRVRLLLGEDGRMSAAATALEPTATSLRCAVSPHRNRSGDVLLRHKIDWRERYDGERERLSARFGVDEALFLNERDELCEGSRANLFLQRDGAMLTPPVASGLLPGCLRAELLASGAAREAVLHRRDLDGPGRPLLGSSLRGLVPAVIVPVADTGG